MVFSEITFVLKKTRKSIGIEIGILCGMLYVIGFDLWTINTSQAGTLSLANYIHGHETIEPDSTPAGLAVLKYQRDIMNSFKVTEAQ